MAMNTEDTLREYLRLFVRIPLVGRIGPLARTFDFVADAAPGVKEILAVGKLCYEVHERHYDLVVVDAEASGHIVAQIGTPDTIHELVQVGLVRDQTDWMIDILSDPVRTGLVIVTTPEEMPVTETVELLDRVGGRRPRSTSPAVVANRVLPSLFSERERRGVRRARRRRAAGGPSAPRRAGRWPPCSTPPRWPRPVFRIGPTTSRACSGRPPERPADALRPRAVHQGRRSPRGRAGRRGTSADESCDWIATPRPDGRSPELLAGAKEMVRRLRQRRNGEDDDGRGTGCPRRSDPSVGGSSC